MGRNVKTDGVVAQTLVLAAEWKKPTPDFRHSLPCLIFQRLLNKIYSSEETSWSGSCILQFW